MSSRLILFLECGKRHAKCLVASFVIRSSCRSDCNDRSVSWTPDWFLPVGILRMDIVLMVALVWQHERSLHSAILEAVRRYGLTWLPREQLHEGLHFWSYM